jgi:uncharacterized membrane protein YfcA
LAAPEALAVLAAGLLAGLINAIAGGGTLLSFPILLALGRDPLLANATNSVGLAAGSLAGAFGFRSHVAGVRERLPRLLLLPLVGTTIGAVLLLATPSETFAGLVPYLILSATALFALQEPLGRATTGAPAAAASPLLLLIGIYGGYFGAGIGILLLATLGLLGIHDLHQRNVVKNLAAAGVNGVAALLFVSQGFVLWSDAVLLGLGAIVGGYAGAHLAQRLGRTFVRWAVVALGSALTLWYFAHTA